MLLKVTAAPEQEKRLHRDPEHQDFGSELWIFMVSQQWPTSALEIEDLEAWEKWLHDPVAGGRTTCQVSGSDFFSSLWLRKQKLKEKSSRKYKFIWNLLLWNHSDRKPPASSTYVHFIQLTDICKGCLQPSLLKSIVVNPIKLAILTVSLNWSNSFPWFKFCLEGKPDYLSIIT